MRHTILIKITLLYFAFSVTPLFHASVFAWSDNTHIAVAKAAGYEKWFNAAGADIIKLKAGKIEEFNHSSTIDTHKEITPEFVLTQAAKYDDPTDSSGHLYGAIIGSLREHKKSTRPPKYTEYYIALCAHYIGDLSQPLHTTARGNHQANDIIVDSEVLENPGRVKEKMYPVTVRPDSFEADLAREIARIANLSRQLGLKISSENRDMTKEEAYTQLGHSASLFQAVLKCLGKMH